MHHHHPFHLIGGSADLTRCPRCPHRSRETIRLASGHRRLAIFPTTPALRPHLRLSSRLLTVSHISFAVSRPDPYLLACSHPTLPSRFPTLPALRFYRKVFLSAPYRPPQSPSIRPSACLTARLLLRVLHCPFPTFSRPAILPQSPPLLTLSPTVYQSPSICLDPCMLCSSAQTQALLSSNHSYLS